MRACTVSTLGREMSTGRFRVAVGAGMGPGVMEGGGADSTFLNPSASLPVVTEALTFAALISWPCGEVFCCFPVLSEDRQAVFEVDFGFLLVFQCNNTR